MEPPTLGTLPTEVLSQVIEHLSPSAIQALDITGPEFRTRVATQPRVLRSSPERPVEAQTLRLFPNVQRVEGLVKIPKRDNDLALVSRRLVGDLEVVQENAQFVDDVLALLIVRGLLYPQSRILVTLTTPYPDIQYTFEYRPTDSFLRLPAISDAGYLLQERLLQALPFTSLQLDQTIGGVVYFLGMGSDVEEKIEGLEARYPNLVEGDITFSLQVPNVGISDLIYSRIQSSVQEFHNRHPRLKVSIRMDRLE